MVISPATKDQIGLPGLRWRREDTQWKKSTNKFCGRFLEYIGFIDKQYGVNVFLWWVFSSTVLHLLIFRQARGMLMLIDVDRQCINYQKRKKAMGSGSLSHGRRLKCSTVFDSRSVGRGYRARFRPNNPSYSF